MDRFDLKLKGRVDQKGNEYYYTTTRLPVTVDLSDTVLLVFPWEAEDEKGERRFGADLVIKQHDPEFNAKRDALDQADDQS